MILSEKIKNSPSNQEIELSPEESRLYRCFKISFVGKDYTWVLKPRNRGGFVYPMINTNHVRLFKSSLGCKRNLIKKLMPVTKELA